MGNIIQVPVQSFIEKKLCQMCTDGQVESTEDPMLLSDPPQFVHRCNSCGNEQYFRDKWPKIVYKEIT